MSGSPSSTQITDDPVTSHGKDTYIRHAIQNETECNDGGSACPVVPDEVETIEKIAEMVSTARRESPERNQTINECCPKTKKQRQVLISQKQENALATAISGSPFLNNSEAINLCTSCAPVKTDEKCRFEEVEIKLEEMFAGIEDEQPTSLSKEHEETSQPTEGNNIGNIELNAITEKTIPTKAAIKSAEGVTYPLETKLSVEIVDCTTTKSALSLRRLSIATQPTNSSEKPKELQLHDTYGRDKEVVSMTNHGDAGIRVNKEMSCNTNIIAKKSKVFGNKRKNFNETTKKGKISNSKHKKKSFVKFEEPGAPKMKHLKFKNRRSQNSSSSGSENDQDERAQQTIDTKYRSPYILVKNDGTISVVNTATADDCSDKNNKIKRTGNYVPERRNVRGIYSSTLSNKYDADTADSTWICVFCKRGPHKKGLGDLFGPYIINIDNDEYKTPPDVKVQHLAATHIKRRRIDMPYNSTGSPITAQRKCETDTNSTVNKQEAPDDGCMDSSPQRFFSGMSRLSTNNFEIWFHEDCAVWAPNLYIVGSRLVGLDSAIWQSTFHTCVCCAKSGAIICCLQRDCKETAHLPCARENNWRLEETKFWAHCARHHVSNYGSSVQKQLLRDRIDIPC